MNFMPQQNAGFLTSKTSWRIGGTLADRPGLNQETLKVHPQSYHLPLDILALPPLDIVIP